MLPIALMATVFGSMLEYKNGIVNQILRGVGLGALAQRWLADPKLAMGAVCSVSIFMIGIPIMYYTADLTTISRSILEAATIDGANKFKTITVEIDFLRKINKDEITIRNLLKMVLLNSTKNYNTDKKLIIKSEELFDIKIFSSNNTTNCY